MRNPLPDLVHQAAWPYPEDASTVFSAILDQRQNSRTTCRQRLLETYRALRDELGRRPLAAELVSHGVLPKTVSKADGSWFQFVHSEGDFTTVEHEVLERHSMWLRTVEPSIPSDSWCLFKPCPMGSRQNRLLLVQVNTHLDPQSGGRYTVKKYRSTKRSTSEGWEHQTIELVPINPHFSPIEITNDNSDEMRIMGEYVGIISK